MIQIYYYYLYLVLEGMRAIFQKNPNPLKSSVKTDQISLA